MKKVIKAQDEIFDLFTVLYNQGVDLIIDEVSDAKCIALPPVS